MKKTITILILIFISPFFILTAMGQPPPPPPQDIPIDGGLLFLLFAGLIYGGKKFYKNDKEKNTQ